MGGGGSGDGREGGEKRVKVNEDVAAIRVKTAASRAHLFTVHPADCVALIKYKATPRAAKLGLWTAAQHLGVLRSIFVRGVGMAHIPRLVAAAPSAKLASAIAQVANTKDAMQRVLRFAVRYCTPTAAESERVGDACEAVDGTAAVARWLSNGVSPDAVDREWPLLVIASGEGRVDTVELLLAVGADVDKAKTTDGATPHFIAAQNGHTSIVEKLIAAGALVDKARTTDGSTPLWMAAQNGHTSTVEKLIAAGADVDKAKTTDGSTPLFIAAEMSHLAVVTKLAAAGADVDKVRTTDGSTPLYKAAEEGHTAVVSKLLQHGADKSIRGWQNETPLEAAQRTNHAAIITLLA